jgi:nucleoside-diphosphate-sugar epimerase
MQANVVLVTGATGFLGGAFLDRVLWQPGSERNSYVLLARGRDEADSRARVLARLSRFRSHEQASAALARCQVLCGDLQTPATLDQPALDRVTHVLHLAANTSFISGQGVWETNYDGTLALARRLLQSTSLRRFLYVGTAMICGEEPPHQVHEDQYPSSVEHLVEYTASKAAAERALLQLSARLPLVIARPSIVIGHTRLGCQPSGSIFWVFRALDELGLVSVDPATTGIDVVPSDWVAEALEQLLFAPVLSAQIYHLSAGRDARTNLGRLTRAFAAAQGKTYDEGRYARIRSDEIRNYRQTLASTFGRLDGRRMELVLSLYLAFCELDVTFDNARILAEGVRLPPPLTDYLSVCLDNPKGIGIVAQAADEL